MADCDISSVQTISYQSWAVTLWRNFRVWRADRAGRLRRKEALRELNAAQLRDIGFVSDGSVLPKLDDTTNGF